MLTRLHAALFSFGMTSFLIGLLVPLPSLLLVSGPCLALSGVLIWVGSRITFAGPFGDILRVALGRTRVFTLHLRAVVWLLLGISITAWGVHALFRTDDRELPWPPVLFAREQD